MGVTKLAKCSLLRKLCFLGCAALKDDGIIGLAKELTFLEEIDVGSTNITGESLRELTIFCLNLKKVNITGCKKLNASDDLILRQNSINVESGEDIFRFHLVPEYNSDLPKITTSVLKTRSTLSLHKVYKYLVKKLEEANFEDESDAPIEQSVIIVCNGEILSSSLQLKKVKEQFWPNEDKLLTLNYKRKDAHFQAVGNQQRTFSLGGMFSTNLL